MSLSALTHNYQTVRRQYPSAKLLAVVKAEGYGHGLVKMAEVFAGLGSDYLGVSFLEEGVLLREAGISTPILVMGGLVDEQVQRYLDHDLTLTVSSVWKAEHAAEVAANSNSKAKVHLKYDTGMGRVGQNWKRADLLIGAVTRNAAHLDVEGVYSHFAAADELDLTSARTQLDRFHNVLQLVHSAGIEVPLVHMANSGAVLQLPEAHFDMVRPGILLYGYPPSEHLVGKLNLIPAMTLRSRVVFVKKPEPGTPIGYGSTYRTTGKWIATLPIGYGDGYPRRAGNRASIVMNGSRRPVVGAVSMDQITVEAADSCYLGDEATIFGGTIDPAHIWDTCRAIDAIPYELLCGLTARVPRVYID